MIDDDGPAIMMTVHNMMVIDRERWSTPEEEVMGEVVPCLGPADFSVL